MNLAEPEGDLRREEIVMALSTEGLEDIPAYFLLIRCSYFHDGRTWSMVRVGREDRSWTDYILEMDYHFF